MVVRVVVVVVAAVVVEVVVVVVEVVVVVVAVADSLGVREDEVVVVLASGAPCDFVRRSCTAVFSNVRFRKFKSSLESGRININLVGGPWRSRTRFDAFRNRLWNLQCVYIYIYIYVLNMCVYIYIYI